MNYPTILSQMEADLRHCRRKIAISAFSVRVRSAIYTFTRLLVGISGVAVILRIATGSIPELNHLLIVILSTAALFFAHVLWKKFTAGPIDIGNVAERLDLSASTHNRIATAIDFLRSGDDSEFAKAAIRDGLECLASVQLERPFMDMLRPSWRRIISLMSLSLVLILISAFIDGKSNRADHPGLPGNGGKPMTTRLENPPSDPHSKSLSLKVIAEKERTVARDPGDRQSGEGGESTSPKPSDDAPSAGSVGQHAPGNARRSQTASNSRNSGGATSGAGADTKPKSSGSPKPQKSGASKPVAKEQMRKKPQKGGSINARGSSGSGAVKTSESDWSSKVEAQAGNQDDSVEEDEPDEEADGEKQRLGMQPGLKNRVARVSRELSLAMGGGNDNSTTKGRGGPSPQKKSRGTTTMILGVPIPGFVRGRLLPGSTKSTQEEAEPSSRLSTYTTPTTVTPSAPREEHQERFRPSVDDSLQASQYLIDLHKNAENKTNKKKD